MFTWTRELRIKWSFSGEFAHLNKTKNVLKIHLLNSLTLTRERRIKCSFSGEFTLRSILKIHSQANSLTSTTEKRIKVYPQTNSIFKNKFPTGQHTPIPRKLLNEKYEHIHTTKKNLYTFVSYSIPFRSSN